MIKDLTNNIQRWSKENLTGLFFFNLLIFILLLLRSAGYFDPFLPLSINLIFLLTIIASVPLLKSNSRTLFLLSISFLSFGAMFKLLHVDIWAERMGIYTYEAFVLGLILVIWETFRK